MGARTFELTEETSETALLASGQIMVDAIGYPVGRRVTYASLRRPIRAPEVLKATAYTLAAADHGALLVFTAAVNLTVPIAGALLVGFRCQIYADGAAVAVARAGGGSFTLAAGELAMVQTANNKVLAYKTAAPVIL